MPEQVKSTPRKPSTPMTADPKLMIGIGEKGGVSIYGLGRFPVTLYSSQWERLMDEEVLAEIASYIESNKDLLSEKLATKTNGKEVEDRQFKVSSTELALVSAEVSRLLAGDMTNPQTRENVVKFATIKEMASGGRQINYDQLSLIMELKARK